MKRKHSPQHDFWHPRVEGQIRHTIGRHPEWFAEIIKTSEMRRESMVNSLAKRIVGEIVAGSLLVDNGQADDFNCGPAPRGNLILGWVSKLVGWRQTALRAKGKYHE